MQAATICKLLALFLNFSGAFTDYQCLFLAAAGQQSIFVESLRTPPIMYNMLYTHHTIVVATTRSRSLRSHGTAQSRVKEPVQG